MGEIIQTKTGFLIDSLGVIIDYIGNDTVVEIPASFDGVAVTAIGDEAFKDKKLTNVIIPDSVTSIGCAAFWGNQLTKVTIPDGVTYIGHNAFCGNQLTSIVIPNSVTYLCGFGDNRLLASVTMGNSVTSIGDDAFHSCRLTKVGIPDNVTHIGNYAFSGNLLTSINIPDNVTYIGPHAFSSNQLTKVIVPNKVTAIGGGAFDGNQLNTITIGANVELRDENGGLFGDGLGAMFTFSFDQTFDLAYENNGKKAGTYLHSNNSWTINGEIVAIHEQFENGVIWIINGKGTLIGKGPTRDYPETLVIPAEIGGIPVTAIGENVFRHNGAKKIIIPKSVVSIGYGAFENAGLSEVTIGANVTLATGGTSDYRRFDDFYNDNGKKEGAYVYSDGAWKKK